MKKIFIGLSIISMVLFGSLYLPNASFAGVGIEDGGANNSSEDGGAGEGESKTGLQITLTNPLKSNDLESFVSRVVAVLLRFLIPILAILFIYTGFQIVTSKGDKAQLEKAKQRFFNLVIGATLILGAWTFGNVIMNTLKEVGIIDK